MNHTLESLDELGVHVTTTYHHGADDEWGYQVQAPWRFVREEANFPTRAKAEQAGLAAGLYEATRLTLDAARKESKYSIPGAKQAREIAKGKLYKQP